MLRLVESRRAVEILDVHSLTKNGTGFSNMRFHCDQSIWIIGFLNL